MTTTKSSIRSERFRNVYYEFISVMDSRTGRAVTEIKKVAEPFYVHSGYRGTEYVRRGGLQKGYEKTMAVIEGYPSYDDMDIWVELMDQSSN